VPAFNCVFNFSTCRELRDIFAVTVGGFHVERPLLSRFNPREQLHREIQLKLHNNKVLTSLFQYSRKLTSGLTETSGLRALCFAASLRTHRDLMQKFVLNTGKCRNTTKETAVNGKVTFKLTYSQHGVRT
jgi:hypothetical protein